MTRYMALDPGGTTGVASLSEHDFRVRQIGPKPHHRELWRALQDYKPNVLIYESYRHRSQQMHDTALLPMEYIGVVKLWLTYHPNTEVHTQETSAMKFWDDDKIKSLNLWLPSSPHAMDALRHLLYHMAFTVKDETWLMKLKK